MRYAIERCNKGTTISGKPAPDRVYVVDIGHISPGCWSSTSDPKLATTWASEADALKATADGGRCWRDVRVVEIDQ